MSFYCDNTVNASFKIKDTAKSSNLPSHRPKPYDLEMNPTRLLPQAESIITYGRIARMNVLLYGFNCSNGKAYQLRRDFWTQVTPSASFLVNLPPLDWSLDMRNKIAADKVNIGADLAEYKDAAHTFKQLASALYHTYRDLKRGKFNHFLKEYGSLKNIAAGLLMYDYGLKPLANTLGSSVAALEMASSMPIRRRYVVTKRDEVDKTVSTYRVKQKAITRAKVWVEYIPDYSPIDMGNPLEWAWEVIPFSFLVDWAFPIGEWIGSLDAMKGVRSVIGSVTYKREYEHTALPSSVDSSYTIEVPASYKYRSHSRDVVTSVPLPPFPGYEPSPSWRHVAQGLALLTVINRG